MKNKTNKVIVLTLIGVVLIVSIIIFILNYSKDEYSYSLIEKNGLRITLIILLMLVFIMIFLFMEKMEKGYHLTI